MAALGTYQTTLFAQGEPAVVADAAVHRRWLDATSWIDLSRSWLQGADELLARFAATIAWRGGRRPMYGRLVDEPRLHATLDLADAATPAVVHEMVRVLDHRYREGFDASFLNYYRNGSDSVAWHADRVGRHEIDPLVVVVSLGGPRRFHLRPMGGGPSVRLEIGSGDLLVMGGACQHHWEHCVPKMGAAAPRMSITLRRSAHLVDDQWWHRRRPEEA